MTPYNEILWEERARRFEWGCRFWMLIVVVFPVIGSALLSVWLAL